MIATDARAIRPARHPRQQCRHPACRAARAVSGRRNGTQILAINLSSAFHTMRLALPAMRAERLRPHHQYRLGAWAGRLALQVGLCRGQARHRRPDQGRGAGDRRSRASPATRSARATSIRRWSRRRSTARPRRTAFRASRSSATCCWRSSRTSASRRSRRSARSRSFSPSDAAASITGIALAGRWRLDRALSRSSVTSADRSANIHRRDDFRRERDMNKMQNIDASDSAQVARQKSARARSSSSCRAAARSAPTRPASIRRCTRPASSRTGSSAPRSAPSTPA